MSKVLKLDPSRTLTLRRSFAAELRRRFKLLKGRVVKLINDEDALALNANPNHDQKGRFARAAGAVYHAYDAVETALGLKALYHGGQQLAKAVARERGYSTQHVESVGKVLAWADGISRWTGNVPGVHAGLEAAVHAAVHSVGGPVTAGLFIAAKVGFYIPVASLGYAAGQLAVGAAKGENPFATIKAARERVRQAAQSKDLLKALGVNVSRSLVAELLDKWDTLDTATLCAALDETGGDLAFSMKLAAAQLLTENDRWKFHTDSAKIDAFQEWLKTQTDTLFTTTEALWKRYAEHGYKKGAARAFDDVRRQKVDQTSDFYAGTRDEFLRSSFGSPVAVDKIKQLAARSFDDMENVTADMGTRMSRVLSDGLIAGESPRDIAETLADAIDIGENRALTIARTEIIRAHAEGQLDSMEKLGVEEVGVEVEWSTAEDELVCPLCGDLEGTTLSIEDARGMLPRHPNCRCAWIPAIPAEFTENMLRNAAEQTRDSHGRWTKEGTHSSGYSVKKDAKTGFTVHDPSGAAVGWKLKVTEAKKHAEQLASAAPVAPAAPLEQHILRHVDEQQAVDKHSQLDMKTLHSKLPAGTTVQQMHQELERLQAENKVKLHEATRAGELLHSEYTIKKYPREDRPGEHYVQLGYVTRNAFCPTGKGGGIDSSCGKSKFQGETVGKAEIDHSAGVERSIAKAVKGKWEEDNKPYDVLKGDDGIEVKSMLKGSKTTISVHDDALLRKVDWVAEKPGRQFHTVVVDERATYSGGDYIEKYSGNRMYYKRGSGRYSLSSMHPVSSEAELRKLIAADDASLPEKAKGSLPTDVKGLKERAAAAHESRLAKDRARKERLKAAGTSAYERQT